MIDDLRQLHWLAGLLEGEGSFMAPAPSSPKSPIIRLMMTDEDVVARAAALFGNRYHRVKIKREGAKDAFSLSLRGYRAYLLMKQLYPLMSIRRKEQIDRALANYIPLPKKENIKDEIIRKIKLRLAKNSSRFAMIDIAAEFKIPFDTVRNIHHGRTGNHISIEEIVED